MLERAFRTYTYTCKQLSFGTLLHMRCSMAVFSNITFYTNFCLLRYVRGFHVICVPWSAAERNGNNMKSEKNQMDETDFNDDNF